MLLILNVNRGWAIPPPPPPPRFRCLDVAVDCQQLSDFMCEPGFHISRSIITLKGSLRCDCHVDQGAETSDSESSALVDVLRRELDDLKKGLMGEKSLRQQLAAANENLRRAQEEIERYQAPSGTDDNRGAKRGKPNR